VDFADENSVLSLRAQLQSLSVPIDGIVKCAGGNRGGANLTAEMSLENLPVNSMEALISENLCGLFYVAKYLVPLLGENPKGGSFVSIGSMAGLRPLSIVGAYSALMAAEHNFVQWLARELAVRYGDKVRANVVAPGFFPADQNMALLYEDSGGASEKLTPRGEAIISHTPFGRFGNVYQDLSGVVALMLSDDSCFMTGSVIPVCGGFGGNSGV
jgi:NAD(P)-dependent dehydrogenase (short-subunit alcohol dehydrogenase family)